MALRYAVPPMTAPDTADYIAHHLKLAGRSDTLFSDDAVARIHKASRGLPRAVNNLAIQALIAAYADGASVVDDKAGPSRRHRGHRRMNWQQLRLFEVPDDNEDPEIAPHLLRIRLGADLPGPGYDSMIVEFLADLLRRLEHDGLFPGRINVEAEVDYIDFDYPQTGEITDF